MQLNEFTKALTSLCDFYERKEPKQATIELWFRLVQRMPSEPIPWIVKKIQETQESFPRNMTAAFWGSYTEWQQAYPDKKAHKDYFHCPDCNDGLIFAKKEKNGVKYSYVFRCVKCKQDNTKAYPMASRLELLQEYNLS
jgi:hypothetical protein